MVDATNYDRAQQLLAQLGASYGGDGNYDNAQVLAAMAQAHATLALADAVSGRADG